MADCSCEKNKENLIENDSLVKLLQELHNRRGVLEQGLSTWQEKYSDIINFEEELGMSNFFVPIIYNSPIIKQDQPGPSRSDFLRPDDFCGSNASSDCEKDQDANGEKENPQIFEQSYFSSVTAYNDEDFGTDDYYFEVSSLTKDSQTSNDDDDTISMQALLERLKETKEKVSEKCNEFKKVIGDISKEANESLSLRERVSMTHRSLTLIEMRQEKAMREALYENVTSNCTIRRLQDEVIQLRIREAQHQSDIQRLVAENNRLKMKLMEARFHGSSSKKPKKTKPNPQVSAVIEEKKKENFYTNATMPGLHEIDDLSKPVCSGAIQRGALALYKTKRDDRGTICVSEQLPKPEPESILRKRKNPCPLCSSLPCDDIDAWDEDTGSRSIGTSTADIENIVAMRNSIVVMGLVLPIPLFLSCLLRTLEESMMMLGRVCFAELPPFDPTIPGLHEEIMEALNQMYVRVKHKIE